MKKAVAFFRGKVSVEGGYIYRCSEDLSLREGEEVRRHRRVHHVRPQPVESDHHDARHGADLRQRAT